MELKRVSVVVVVAMAVTITLLGSSVTEVEAVFDVPPQADGFYYPTPLPQLPIVMEIYSDPMCPFSKAAWPITKRLVNFYGSKLFVTVHLFPVPFHRNSFISTRGIHIATKLNASTTIPLLELMFKHQDILTTNITYNTTPANVTKTVIDLAVQAGLPEDKMIAGFEDPNTDFDTRASFKYICSRYITDTPSFLINGAPITADETWTVDVWKQFLDPLFAQIGS